MAIATNNPRLVLALINQGWMVLPNDVENLIKQTSRWQSPEIFEARLELSQLLIDMSGVKPMSVEAIQSLPHNHAQNPLGSVQGVENKFIELVELWVKEVG
jgi:hypothetical protein